MEEKLSVLFSAVVFSMCFLYRSIDFLGQINILYINLYDFLGMNYLKNQLLFFIFFLLLLAKIFSGAPIPTSSASKKRQHEDGNGQNEFNPTLYESDKNHICYFKNGGRKSEYEYGERLKQSKIGECSGKVMK